MAKAKQRLIQRQSLDTKWSLRTFMTNPQFESIVVTSRVAFFSVFCCEPTRLRDACATACLDLAMETAGA